jgi:hypothetical protein
VVEVARFKTVGAVSKSVSTLSPHKNTQTNVGPEDIVSAMDYDRKRSDLVGRQLVEFAEERLAGMDAPGSS